MVDLFKGHQKKPSTEMNMTCRVKYENWKEKDYFAFSIFKENESWEKYYEISFNFKETHSVRTNFYKTMIIKKLNLLSSATLICSFIAQCRSIFHPKCRGKQTRKNARIIIILFTVSNETTFYNKTAVHSEDKLNHELML